MHAKDKPAAAVWIEQRYLQWQIDQGGRRSIAEFAAWLGGPATKTMLVHCMGCTRLPGYDLACMLAYAFDDASIFDTLPLKRRAKPTLLECQLYVCMRWRPLSKAALGKLAAILEDKGLHHPAQR